MSTRLPEQPHNSLESYDNELLFLIVVIVESPLPQPWTAAAQTDYNRTTHFSRYIRPAYDVSF